MLPISAKMELLILSVAREINALLIPLMSNFSRNDPAMGLSMNRRFLVSVENEQIAVSTKNKSVDEVLKIVLILLRA